MKPNEDKGEHTTIPIIISRNGGSYHGSGSNTSDFYSTQNLVRGSSGAYLSRIDAPVHRFKYEDPEKELRLYQTISTQNELRMQISTSSNQFASKSQTPKNEGQTRNSGIFRTVSKLGYPSGLTVDLTTRSKVKASHSVVVEAKKISKINNNLSKLCSQLNLSDDDDDEYDIEEKKLTVTDIKKTMHRKQSTIKATQNYANQSDTFLTPPPHCSPNSVLAIDRV